MKLRRPSPAMLVAVLALLVALGGSAVAAGVLSKKKVKNIATRAINQRISGLTRVSNTIGVAPGQVTSTRATCPAGQTAVSGGAIFISAGGEIFIDDAVANPPRSGWAVGGDNFDSSISGTLTAVAYCAQSGKAVAAHGISRDREDALVAQQREMHGL